MLSIKGKKAVLQAKVSLKKVFDLIFTVNHTFEMIRDGISRLTRRT